MFRLVGPVVALSAVLLILSGMAAWYLHRLQQESNALVRRNVAKTEASEELELLSYRLRNRLTAFLFTDDPKHLAEIPALQQDVSRWLARLDELAATSHERAALTQIKRGYQDFFRELDRIVHDPQRTEHRQRLLMLARQVTQTEIVDPAHRFQAISRGQLSAASQREQVIADRMGLGLLSLGASSAMAGLLVGFTIARGIVERLQESRRAVARAEQLVTLGQLAAGLAHELRNPLTSIKIIVQTAAEQGDPGRLDHRDLTVLEEEITRLDGTIQTFLDYARPSTPQKHVFLLQPAIEQAAALVARSAVHRGVRIQCDLPAESTRIEADEGQLRQVLLNLLLNAVEASPDDGIVEIRACEQRDGEEILTEREQQPTWVRIEVADRGSGLPEDLRPRIFEPFVSSKETGTGLGLPICQRIVEEHGGRITAANRPEGGATFTVWLPVHDNKERPRQEALASRAAET